MAVISANIDEALIQKLDDAAGKGNHSWFSANPSRHIYLPTSERQQMR